MKKEEMIKITLVGDGNVAIKTFDDEESGLKYLAENKRNLFDYYSSLEVVTPGEDDTIWKVADVLITHDEYVKQHIARIKAMQREHQNIEPEEFYGWDD